MSSSNKSNKSGTEVSELMEKFDETVKELGVMGKQIGKLLRAKKRRTPKDPDAEPSESRSAWQDWTSSCTKRFAEDYATHLADVEKKADVMTFASKCKEKTHIDEWKEHEAAWLLAHPKPEKAAKAPKGKKVSKAAVVDEEEEAALVGSSDERGSKKSSKKAAKAVEEPPTSSDERGSTSSKKSKKKMPEPDALPAASAIPEGTTKGKKPKKDSAKDEKSAASLAAAKANPPVPAKYKGKDYLKNELNQVWQVGKGGEVGAWHGTLSEDGKTLTKSDGPA